MAWELVLGGAVCFVMGFAYQTWVVPWIHRRWDRDD